MVQIGDCESGSTWARLRGQAHHRVAVGVQDRVAAFVVARVVPAAVDLHDQPALGPVEVDLEAVQVGVDERLGEAERQERVLAGALRPRAARVMQLDRPLEHVQLVAPEDAAIESRTAASTKRPR